MECSPSANTSTGWCVRSGSDVPPSETSGISLPRYWVTGSPQEVSILSRGMSSSRATRPSGTAIGASLPARNSSIAVFSLERVSSLRCRRAGAAGACLALAAGTDAGGPRDPVGVEDHDHRAVAQDGVAAEHRDVAQDRRHRLDHDFLGVEHAIDDDAQHGGADLGHHDMRGIGLARLLAEAQQVVQVDQRQQPVAQPQHRRAVDPLDHGPHLAVLARALALASPRPSAGCSNRYPPLVAAALRPHQLDDADLRDGEALAAGFDDQRGHDGQRQRDLDGEGAALARHALQVDRAADALDIRASPRPCRRRGRTPR